MFSVDNFYNYLNQYLIDNKKNVELKTFNTHGSRLLKDIIVPSFKTDTTLPKRYAGQVVMFDQEPIELEYFTDWINFNTDDYASTFEYKETGDLYKNLSPVDFIFRHFSAVHNPILCHSERNSPDVELFEKNNFHAVHYFYHGLIARDWFRHWRHYNMKVGEKSMRFGMYCRDVSGSRKYRLDLIEKLIPYKRQLYFQLQEPVYADRPILVNHFGYNTTVYDSTASTIIVPEDCEKFDIQLVPETLFDTQKTHLTEKVFKPIAMKQPFIVVGCPNSLEYLRSYGFKTFHECWDESYDKETDSKIRMDMIINLVETIAKMSPKKYKEMIKEARWIAMYNRQRFNSGIIEDIMLEELHTNLDKAFDARDKEFESMPGGTWFKYLDQLSKEGHDITKFNKDRIKEIVSYLAHNKRLDFGFKIMKKYEHLVDLKR